MQYREPDSQAKFCFFCQISNARSYRFPVGHISRNLNTTRRLMSRQNLKNLNFLQRLATSGRHNSAMIIVQRQFITKWSLCGKSSFHFYRWNQLKVIPLACIHCVQETCPPNFLGRRTTVDCTARYMNLILVTHSLSQAVTN